MEIDYHYIRKKVLAKQVIVLFKGVKKLTSWSLVGEGCRGAYGGTHIFPCVTFCLSQA